MPRTDRRIRYTRSMNRRIPPGFYFVLAVAAVAFVCSSGLTRLRPELASVRDLAVPAGHDRVGVYLTSYAVTKPSTMDAVMAALDAGKIDTLVINVKNMHGEVTYDSAVPLAHAIGASTGRLDLSSIVSDLHARGVYVIARQVVFFDPLLARHLGNEGSWVACDDRTVVEYNLDVAEEVMSLGFDELQFDYIRYPDGGELEAIYATRFAAVEAFLSAARRRLGADVVLSGDIFGRVMWAWNARRIDPIGQSLEDMAPYLDFVSPMVYPSHYYEQSYRDDPYRTVQDALTSGSGRVDAHFRPFLQAFDREIPESMTLEAYIDAQIRAAQAYGADGYLFWHPACEYETLFRVLEPRNGRGLEPLGD